MLPLQVLLPLHPLLVRLLLLLLGGGPDGGGVHHRPAHTAHGGGGGGRGGGEEGEEGGASNGSNGGAAQSTIYAANLRALSLLDELWDHVLKAAAASSTERNLKDWEKEEGQQARQKKVEEKSGKYEDCIPAETWQGKTAPVVSRHHGDVSMTWLTIQQGAVMWVKVLQGLAIACAFGQKPVRVKALGVRRSTCAVQQLSHSNSVGVKVRYAGGLHLCV